MEIKDVSKIQLLFSDFIKPICLPKGNMLKAPIDLIGKKIDVAGWGAKKYTFNGVHCTIFLIFFISHQAFNTPIRFM